MQTDLVSELFKQQGFVLIKQLIEPSTIAKLQNFCQHLDDKAKSHYFLGQSLDNIAITQNADTPYISRINSLFLFKPQFACLLAHTKLMNYVEALIGEPALPTYESIVIKHSQDTHGFDWHRDMPVSTQTPIITVGIYLDDAKAEHGALKVIPRSHCSPLSVCDIKRQLTNSELKSLDVTACAGDVIIHHVNTVHSSARQEAQAIRRTIYFEFRALSHLINNPIFPNEWIKKRQALMKNIQTLSAKHLQHDIQLPSDFYETQIQMEAAEYCIEFTK